MLAYRENNIFFRIASAGAISKFKAVQAHSFIEVCRRDFDFDNKSKEVLLLSYDRFSAWALRTERAFLMLNKPNLSQPFKIDIFNSIVEVFGGIEEICITHKNVFDESVTEYLYIIHEYSKNIIDARIDVIFQQTTENAFVDLLQLISDYLQHVLVALHEYDNNCIKKNAPFLCATSFSVLSENVKDKCLPTVKRAEFFKRKCKAAIAFMVKNYSEQSVEDKLIASLEQYGISAFKEPKKDIALDNKYAEA